MRLREFLAKMGEHKWMLVDSFGAKLRTKGAMCCPIEAVIGLPSGCPNCVLKEAGVRMKIPYIEALVQCADMRIIGCQYHDYFNLLALRRQLLIAAGLGDI